MGKEKKKPDETKEERKAKKKEARARDKARIAEEKRRDKEARFKIENPVRFMRIITIVGIILAVFAVFFGAKYIINMVFLASYEDGSYSPETQEVLQFINIPEGYLPYYNEGNAHYKLGEYDKAIAEYQLALEAHPSEKKECDIRVNLALAMLQKIDFENLDTEKQKANAIRQLQAARNILCEKGCADPYGTNGHDPEAEQLKQDIDKMLEELGAEPEPPQSDQQDQKKSSSGQGQDKKQTRREKQLEEDLKKQRQESDGERQEYQNKHDKPGDTPSGGEEGDDENSGGIGGGQEDDDKKNW